MKILLKHDYRVFKYDKVFGGVDTFNETLLVDAGTLDTEPVGAVTCTLFTTTKIGTAETGKKYDINWLWTQMIQLGKVSAGGASPQDAFSVSIKGMKVIPTGEIDTFPAYFRVDTGSGTAFDNVKSFIQNEFNKGNKRPVGVGTEWFAEYSGVLPNGTLPHGVNHTSDHEWLICGWDKKHPDCFKIDSHEGYYKYITKNEFNYVMNATYGSVALSIAYTTQEQIDILKGQKIDLLKTALDFCYNIYKVLVAKLALVQPQAPTPVPTVDNTYQEVKQAIKMNKIEQWAKLIALEEGDKTGVNPGNMKYTTLTKSWGATQGRPAQDGGHFALFKDYQTGLTALQNFLTLGCEGQLIISHPLPCTFDAFTTRYAGNPPQGYKDAIAKGLGCEMTTDISTFL